MITIEPRIEAGNAFYMSQLLESYKEILQEKGVATAPSYRSQRLKHRLEQYFKERLLFHQHQDASKSELVYSNSVSLQDVINAAVRVPSRSVGYVTPATSNSDVEIILSHAAAEVLGKSAMFGVVLPSNIFPGPFIHAAADNNDIIDETLDGKKTTHSTSIVLYQRGHFGSRERVAALGDHRRKKRACLK